jgi:alanyl-tRNA synthetase
MIAVRSWERAKGMTRIEFVAGMRALTDYRRANKSSREIAALFSTSRDEAPALALHMLEENKNLNRRVRVLEDIAAGVEAERIVSEQQSQEDGTRLIVRTFDDRDSESLKKLAQALTANPKTIALLFSTDKEMTRMVFARSADAPGDMNQLMRLACERLEGRGGGKPDLAQGGGKNTQRINETIGVLREQLNVTK